MVSVEDFGILVNNIDIHIATEESRDQWDTYVERHDRATIYHRWAWRPLIRDVFGHEPHYLMAKSTSGECEGVLPMFRLRSRLFGDFMVSMPFVNYGGALASSECVVRALMEQACHLANELGVEHIEFRDMENRSNWYPVRTDKVIMERVLPETEEDLWSSFDTKLRAQVKRAAKESVEVVWGGGELLPMFYRVFSRNMRDLGTPVYGRSFFQAVLAAFPDSARVIVVKYRNEAVAAALLLGHRERIEIPWASSIRDYNRYGVNMLMYWEALRMATREGYRVFDFGRSTPDSGTFRFKKQWGAKPVPLYWHYWLREGCAMPQLTPNSPKFRVAVNVWQRLPLFVTTLLGPGIVKNLP